MQLTPFPKPKGLHDKYPDGKFVETGRVWSSVDNLVKGENICFSI